MTGTIRLGLVACALLAGCAVHRADSPLTTPRLDGYFPDVVLTDQGGRRLRFYSDILRDKVVLVNFMYTTCRRQCPRVSANLARVQEALGDRLGRDVLMLSLTLDPARDDQAALAGYATVIGAKPGWLFLTGADEDLELLRRRLGMTDPDPRIDADRTRHAGIIVYGNEASGRWAAMPGLSNPQLIAEAVLRVADPLSATGRSVPPPCQTAPVASPASPTVGRNP